MEINITPQGLKLLSDVDVLMDTFYDDLADRITAAEAAVLSDLLDKVRG
jgi:hypothetical protein